MKNKIFNIRTISLYVSFLVSLSLTNSITVNAQDAPATIAPVKLKPVKNTFDGTYVIDNQTVNLPVKKTLEVSLQHRFGVINNGYTDLYGLFAGANVRFGCYYTPFNDLQVGVGLTELKMQWDGNVKYAIVRQSVKGGWPVSITYYANMAMISTDDPFVSKLDRISYFNQIMIARKITDDLSLQVSPSYTHYNNVDGYFASDGTIKPMMNNDHFAIACLGRYKITETFGVIANYDQPLTQHPANNPRPNISFGLEFATAGHVFQIFAGNYSSVLQQANNVFNQNDFLASQYVLGFNLTRKFHL
jgi:hypothetical protein